jgi:lauroyl/myristoyl acyltransferase
MSLPGAALALVRALPASPAILLSRLIVVAYLSLRADYRSEIRRNLRLVLGQDRRLFWVRNAWQTGRNLALMARLGQARSQAIIDRAMLHCDNSVRMSLERELHMVMASFHYGLWEYLPQVLARRGFGVKLVIGEQRDTALQVQLSRLRESGRVRLARSIREAARTGSGPTISGFMLDNTSRGSQVTASADGVSFRVPEFPFRLAERQGGKVIPMFARFEKGRLRVDAYPPTDADGAAQALLEQVRRRPEEWVWWAKAGAIGSSERRAA